MVKDQIMVGVIQAEWNLRTILNCFKGKGHSLEILNCRGLKLTDQVLKKAERIIVRLIGQYVDINEMEFSFMSGCETTNVILILR